MVVHVYNQRFSALYVLNLVAQAKRTQSFRIYSEILKIKEELRIKMGLNISQKGLHAILLELFNQGYIAREPVAQFYDLSITPEGEKYLDFVIKGIGGAALASKLGQLAKIASIWKQDLVAQIKAELAPLLATHAQLIREASPPELEDALDKLLKEILGTLQAIIP